MWSELGDGIYVVDMVSGPRVAHVLVERWGGQVETAEITSAQLKELAAG